MSELTDTLDKIIQKAALDGALTQDAVAQFHTLVKERDALKDANEEWEVEGKKLKHDLDLVQKRVLVLEEECENWAGMEQELLDREKKCHEWELTAKHETQRVADHKHMFETVFRNSVLRKEVMTPLAPGDANQYNSCPPGGFAQKDTVEETEE